MFTPQATLFDNDDKERTTHFFSPNPDERRTIRAAWESSKDASTVWGQVVSGDSSTDANFVAPVLLLSLTISRAR